jgi:hypothetical protein
MKNGWSHSCWAVNAYALPSSGMMDVCGSGANEQRGRSVRVALSVLPSNATDAPVA